MTETVTPKKVLVIGGGYAGTLAANRLLQRGDVHVSFISPEFVERIRLEARKPGR